MLLKANIIARPDSYISLAPSFKLQVPEEILAAKTRLLETILAESDKPEVDPFKSCVEVSVIATSPLAMSHTAINVPALNRELDVSIAQYSKNAETAAVLATLNAVNAAVLLEKSPEIVLVYPSELA